MPEKIQEEIYRIGLTKNNLLQIYKGLAYTNCMFGKFKPCRNFEELYKITENNFETYEYVPGNQPVIGFVDCDFKPEIKSVYNLQEFEERIYRIVRLLEKALEPKYKVTFGLKTAKNPQKKHFSGHLIFQIFENTLPLFFKDVSDLSIF